MLKETLRLYPSIPANVKMAKKDTELSDGTFVQASTSVTIPAYVMGRLENVWGPDVKQFKPERWIDPDTGTIRRVSAFKDNAFGAGPRKCLGMALATTEIKMLLASLFSRFQLELVPDRRSRTLHSVHDARHEWPAFDARRSSTTGHPLAL